MNVSRSCCMLFFALMLAGCQSGVEAPRESVVETAYRRELEKKKIERVEVYYGTNRKPRHGATSPEEKYSAEVGRLVLGRADVLIPRDEHRTGGLEDSIELVDVFELAETDFYAAVRHVVASSDKKDAFIFIHGFNVHFHNAARRTAQIKYDLKFEGAAGMFSFPSQGKLAPVWRFLDPSKYYMMDEKNAQASIPALEKFIYDFAKKSDAETVHLIAHSMGAYMLSHALNNLSAKYGADALPLFNEVILAAPDIDEEVFRHELAPGVAKAAERVTLYASDHDKALLASKLVYNLKPRAGDSKPEITETTGLDLIEVTKVDESFVGHSYYGNNRVILTDMFTLLRYGEPPHKRISLYRIDRGNAPYYEFR